MKKMRLASMLIASILVFSVFFGCKQEPNASSAVLSEPGSAPTISEPPEGVSSQPASSASSGSESPSSATPEELVTIVTSDKAFNKLFVQNPIDKAYKADSENAASTVDMIELAEKYTKIWQTEIDAGYKKLLEKAPADKKEGFKTKQANWVDETPEKLKKIETDAQAGGSLAQVDVAGQTMEYYRARAAAIYKNLYTYDKKFTYAYKAS